MRRWPIAILLGFSLLATACGSNEAALPTFDGAVKGDRVDPGSFLRALGSSFRAGSTAVVTFDVHSGATVRGAGAVRYRSHQLDADLRVDDWKVSGASVDIRVVGGTTYMRVPESRGLWVNLSEGGTGLPGANLADEADPRTTLHELRTTLDQVRFTGRETVRGVGTRRFEVVTRPHDAAGTSTGAAHPVVTDYWFDAKDRVVRRQSELAGASSATFTWAKWGKPVSIKAPKPGEIVTLRHLEELRKQAAARAQ